MKYVDLPGVDSDQVSLTLYPSREDSQSLVVWIHGGAWVSGDRRNVRKMPLFFEENNILFASINYPLTPPSGVSLIDFQIEALQGFDRWLSDNPYKKIYPDAFNNINILSHSSGSHLVALADKRFGWNSSVRSLILMDSGAYDLKQRFQRGRRPQQKMLNDLLKLDLYPVSQHNEILQSFSPALLPCRGRDSNSLEVVIISSKRPGARYSAEKLKNSYHGNNYKCKTHYWDWDHDDFPEAIGNDVSIDNLILDVVKPV